MFYLQCPPDLTKSECRSLKLRAMKYVLIDKILYWKDPGGMLLKCFDRYEVDSNTTKFHGGAYEGHKFWKETTFNTLRAAYYFPNMFIFR